MLCIRVPFHKKITHLDGRVHYLIDGDLVLRDFYLHYPENILGTSKIITKVCFCLFNSDSISQQSHHCVLYDNIVL